MICSQDRIRVCKRAYISSSAVIQAGAIGDDNFPPGAVIQAGALVDHNVPPGATIGRSPGGAIGTFSSGLDVP